MEKSKMSFLKVLPVFGGFFLQIILKAFGFKKTSQKLDRLEKIIEEYLSKTDDSFYSRLFKRIFFIVSMAMLMTGIRFFTEVNHLCSKK
jgi:hypothetical protein